MLIITIKINKFKSVGDIVKSGNTHNITIQFN